MKQANLRVKTRLYVTMPLNAGGGVTLSAAQSHHLVNVMRAKAGEMVTLFNGRDGEWLATIEAAHKKNSSLVVLEQLRKQDFNDPVTVYFAPVKKQGTDLVIEKLTELGVSDIAPVLTEHSETQRINEDRWQTIATEAAEQSERLDIPVIHPLNKLSALLRDWPKDGVLYVALEREDAVPALQAFADHPKLHKAGLLVGPEGGFSVAERALFAKHDFVKPVSLGKTILRAETASIVLAALWQQAL